MQITALHTYPVKSMRGIALSEAQVHTQGLPHDREWLLTTPSGQFISARTHPQLLLWQVACLPDGIQLTAPDGDSIHVAQSTMQHIAPVTVWQDQFPAYHGNRMADEWLSHQLDTPCRLFWLGKHSQRTLAYSQTPLSFADGAPFLIASEASLHHLNTLLDTPVEMARFRANVVIDGTEPYAEDTWQRIRIGEVIFELFKPCVRCVMTTVDLHTAQKHPQQQPLRTLAQTHRAVFGINMIAHNTGIIRVGDSIEVLTYHV